MKFKISKSSGYTFAKKSGDYNKIHINEIYGYMFVVLCFLWQIGLLQLTFRFWRQTPIWKIWKEAWKGPRKTRALASLAEWLWRSLHGALNSAKLNLVPH